VQSNRCKQIISLCTVGVSLLLVACGAPKSANGVTSGCQRIYGGGEAVDRPETSRLSCAAINEMTFAMPSKPETYLSRSDSPRLLWKCKFYGARAPRVLLRCEHQQRHFSIVKSAN
jgi:hypothetical protein